MTDTKIEATTIGDGWFPKLMSKLGADSLGRPRLSPRG